MSLQRVVEEVIRPYFLSCGETDPEGRLTKILGDLKAVGALIPQVAASLEVDDFKDFGLPPPIVRVLVAELKKDTVPRSTVANDPQGRLRPASFDQIVGHAGFKELAMDAILASRKRGEPLKHMLLTGPRGIGKTTLALAIAHERGVDMRVLTGAQFQKPFEMVAEILRWKLMEIVFIDEIHGLGRLAQEMLYGVMEDGTLSTTEQRKTGSMKVTVPAAKVTVIGATTHPSKLLQPFRNRFPIAYQLPFYSDAELLQIARRSCLILGLNVCEEGLVRLVQSCRDNPRTLNHFLVQPQDAASARGQTSIDLASVERILMLNGYGPDGLRSEERRYLESLKSLRAASLQTLARTLDIPVEEVEFSIEPWLVRKGLVRISARGRTLNVETMDPQKGAP